MHVEREGAGPVVLLLHGFTGSSESWQSLSTELRSRYSVATVDLPGHGRSGAMSDAAEYRLDRVADALAALLDDLRAERAAVLGYSMGGRTALRFALRHPARFDALILESTSPGIADPAQRAARRRADAELAHLLEREGIAAFVDAWERLPLWGSQSALSPEARDRLRALRLSQSPAGLAMSLREAGAAEDEPVLERLGGVRVPVLLVAGALDQPYVAHARAMAQRLPNARVEVVPDAGHAVHLEQPAAYATVVKTFLAAHSFPRSTQENE